MPCPKPTSSAIRSPTTSYITFTYRACRWRQRQPPHLYQWMVIGLATVVLLLPAPFGCRGKDAAWTIDSLTESDRVVLLERNGNSSRVLNTNEIECLKRFISEGVRLDDIPPERRPRGFPAEIEFEFLVQPSNGGEHIIALTWPRYFWIDRSLYVTSRQAYEQLREALSLSTLDGNKE